ncbi:DUF4867 family protein [Halobacillus mangrovi]|uniref:DUF4867 family protein n=1 Tax=Halobacillus mangrovi TaxID=402384 RepID=UPI003D950D75
MLEKLRKQNTNLFIRHVQEESFTKYGRVLEDFPSYKALEDVMRSIPIPEEGNQYQPSVECLEIEAFKKIVERKYYGAMDIQIGYCNGTNSNLGGLEFHKGSEINVALTDMILLLGHYNHLYKNIFETKFLEAFYIPKGTALEIFQTTLHLAPCKVAENGFKCLVILPKGTNTTIDHQEKQEDPLLFMKNKWLLAHEEHERFVSQGAHIGIKGPNVFVQYLK